MRFFQPKAVLLVVGICSVCLLSGCVKAPDAELAAARDAIKAAEAAEADIYMAKNFQNMQKALETAEAEIATQKQGFVLTRKYKNVTEMLGKIVEHTTEMTNKAPKVKADMTAQVKENLGLVDGMLEETENDIKRAKRVKDKNVISELKLYLVEADSAAVRAKADFEAGNIMSAKDNLSDVQAYMKKITDTLKPKTES